MAAARAATTKGLRSAAAAEKRGLRSAAAATTKGLLSAAVFVGDDSQPRAAMVAGRMKGFDWRRYIIPRKVEKRMRKSR